LAITQYARREQLALGLCPTILTHLIDMSIPVDQLLIVGDNGSFQQFSKTDLDMQARVLVARALDDLNVDCLDTQATFVVRNGRHITGTLHGEGAPLKANPEFSLYVAYMPNEPDKDGRKTPIIKGGVVRSGYGYAIVAGVLCHIAGAKSQSCFFVLAMDEKGPEKPIWCVAAPCPAHDTRTAPRAHLSLPSARAWPAPRTPIHLSRRPSLFVFPLHSCSLSHARAVFDQDSPTASSMPQMATQGLKQLKEMLLTMPRLPSCRTLSKNSLKCACCALPHAAAPPSP